MSLIPDLPSGLVLGDDFEILRLLGHGGMGTVYEARQKTTGASRAIKVMHSSHAGDRRFRQRFAQEALVSARIPSDHVVQVISAGVDTKRYIPWIAMELLEGQDLGAWLDTRGPMAIGDARAVVEQLCHALSAAHSVGVVHRDLKPENIFLGKSRTVGIPFMVKVLDFGVAKILSESARAATVAVGTPYYMAPEQTRPSEDIGPGSDVWALGLVLFRLLTGHHYWLSAASQQESLAALWREMLFDVLPPASERARDLGLRELPAGFDEWFAKCIEREVGDRFVDAAEAHEALAPILDDAAGVEAAATPPRSFFSTRSATEVGSSLSSSLAGTRARTRPRLTFREGPERVLVDANVGETILEASLNAGLPHYHACGARARCTTCRVVVLDGLENLSNRDERESKIAARRKWPLAIRLACQAQVKGNATVRRLVVDSEDAATVSSLHITTEPQTEHAVLLHAELAAFDRFAAEQFPHDIVHVLNRYLRQMVEPILANDGRVVEYTPSGVLASFSSIGGEAPASAIGAIRSALRLLARVRQINPYTLRHFGHEFDVAVSIDVGEIVRADIGHEDHREPHVIGYTVQRVAEGVRLAAREGAKIVISSAVVRELDDQLQLGRPLSSDTWELIDFAKPDVVFLVQSTFERLTDRAEPFARAFYDRLFEIHPPAAVLFDETDMTMQREMLMDVLAMAVRGLDKMDELVPVLADLGIRHVTYGVEPLHYKHVGRALLETLEEFLGDSFTPEVHVAWMEIYGVMARTMIEASSSPAAKQQSQG